MRVDVRKFEVADPGGAFAEEVLLAPIFSAEGPHGTGATKPSNEKAYDESAVCQTSDIESAHWNVFTSSATVQGDQIEGQDR